MAATTLQSLLGKHTEIISEFKDQLAKTQAGRPVANDAGVRGKTRLLESIDGRLANAKTARQATLARHDGRIAALEDRSKRLRTEIETDKENMKRRGRGGKRPGIPGLTRPGRGRAPVQGPKKPSVTDIKGVGDAYRRRLEAEGIRTAADLAKTKPAVLAEALSISEARAKALVAAAKKVKK